MSLEKLLSDLIDAIKANTQALQGAGVTAPAPVAPPAMPAAPFVAPAPVEAPPAPPAPVAPAALAAAMAAPAASLAAALAAAPFNSTQGLVDYASAAYTTLATAKGQQRAVEIFNGALAACGVDNVNNIQPASYGTFYQAIEAAKAQP